MGIIYLIKSVNFIVNIYPINSIILVKIELLILFGYLIVLIQQNMKILPIYQKTVLKYLCVDGNHIQCITDLKMLKLLN